MADALGQPPGSLKNILVVDVLEVSPLCPHLSKNAGNGPSVKPRFVGDIQDSKAGVDSGSGGFETLVHERCRKHNRCVSYYSMSSMCSNVDIKLSCLL